MSSSFKKYLGILGESIMMFVTNPKFAYKYCMEKIDKLIEEEKNNG